MSADQPIYISDGDEIDDPVSAAKNTHLSSTSSTTSSSTSSQIVNNTIGANNDGFLTRESKDILKNISTHFGKIEVDLATRNRDPIFVTCGRPLGKKDLG